MERSAERHPNITKARDIAFQGRHDEGVLERMNLILYKRFKKNIDDWRMSRAEDFEKAGNDIQGLKEADGNFSFALPREAFISTDYDFVNFPHSKMVGLLSDVSDDKLVVHISKSRIGVVNQARGSGFEFVFRQDGVVTQGAGSTAYSYCDPMEGKSLMTKISAACEFIDFIDLKLEELKAQTPVKVS